MTPQDFQNWRSHMGWSQQRAADALGLSRVAIADYERGTTAGRDPKPRPVPPAIALACAALACGLSAEDAIVQDMPEPDMTVDHTPHRALQASILDNAHKPDAVRALTARWWESERELLQALIDEQERLSLKQTVLLHRAVGA